MNATVSEKGQITIPKALRDSLGLTPGARIEFSEEAGQLVGRKVLARDPFQKWMGKGQIPGNVTVDDYLNQTRGGA